MKQQLYFQHRLQTLSALHDAVGAMRSLSAHQFRRARLALAAARAYRDEMNVVIARIGLNMPLHAAAPAAMLLLASDLGLCGDYNSRLSQLALREAGSRGIQRVYSVGRRPRSALGKHGMTFLRQYDAPSSLEGLGQLLGDLVQHVLDDFLSSRIGSLQVISAGFDGVGHFTPLSIRVLPIEPVPPLSPAPLSPYVDTERLMFVAAREFLYITFYEILLDALAAEHGMRLMAAEAALEWLEGSMTVTSRRLVATRSEASTQELLDIVSGSRQRFRQR